MNQHQTAHPLNRIILFPVAALCFVAFVSSVFPGGSSFQVNSTLSNNDAAPGNGVCETATGNGVCTLHAAIQEANANTAIDVNITFNLPTTDPEYELTGAWHIPFPSAGPQQSLTLRTNLGELFRPGRGQAFH